MKRRVLHDSIDKGNTRKSAYNRNIALPKGVLQLGTAAACGDYVRQEIVKRAEFNAQHGEVKVIYHRPYKP